MIAPLVLIFGVLLITGTFAWGALRGAPWVPTRHRDVARVIACASPRAGAYMVDVGCGDGAILAAFAARGCRVRGWELAFLPWVIAVWRLRRWRDAHASYGDFWHASIADADIVYAFLMPKTLARLAEKLRRELRTGAQVLTYVWPLPGWTPEMVDRPEGSPPLYRYRVP